MQQVVIAIIGNVQQLCHCAPLWKTKQFGSTKKKPHDFPQQQHALCTRQHSSRHRCLLCFLGVNERCVGSISKTRRVPPTSRQPRHAVKKQSKYEVFIHWFFFPNYKETQISEEKYSSKGERRDLFSLWTFLIAGSPHVPALKT